MTEIEMLRKEIEDLRESQRRLAIELYAVTRQLSSFLEKEYDLGKRHRQPDETNMEKKPATSSI